MLWFASGSEPASPGAITQAEVGTATDLRGVSGSEAVRDFDGWDPTESVIPTPDILSLDTSNIPGETTYGTASITYYFDDVAGNNPIFDLLSQGTKGMVVLGHAGSAVDDRSEAFAVEVQSRRPDYNVANEASTFTVTFAIAQPTAGAFVA